MVFRSKDTSSAQDEFVYLENSPDFRSLLKRFFERSRISYTALANAADRDVAYVHRLINTDRVHPSSNTVIRLALALKLGLPETDELLLAAGYAPLVHPAQPKRGEAERHDGPAEISAQDGAD